MNDNMFLENDILIESFEMTHVGESMQAIKEEFTTGRRWSVMLGPKIKDVKQSIKDGKRAQKNGDTATAKKNFDHAEKVIGEIKKEANTIDDDGFWDWMIKLCVYPLWLLLGYTIASGSFGAMNRNLVIKELDKLQATIRRLKSTL